MTGTGELIFGSLDFFVLSVSDQLDEALVQQYGAMLLSESDGYRIVLKDPSKIHLGDSRITAFLEIK